MIYRAAGTRCAVNLREMNLPISAENEIRGILSDKGFREIDVDISALAKSLVGVARWKLPARQYEAPQYFDCASFVKWIYAQRGITIPRRCMQQFEFCRTHAKILDRDEVFCPGDLLFVTSPFVHGKRTDEHNGIGHVCLVIDNGDVVCATNSEFGLGVVKIPFHQICATRKICGTGRIVSREAELITLLTPPHREIETSDDVRWIILQSLGKR